MTGLLLGLLLLAVLAVLALQIMQWLRPASPAELPPEWWARLTQLEQTLQASAVRIQLQPENNALSKQAPPRPAVLAEANA